MFPLLSRKLSSCLYTAKVLPTILTLVAVAACGDAGTGAARPKTHAISGVIASAPGATVTVSGSVEKTATTDANGAFTVAGLAPGSYMVTPTQPGFRFDPVEIPITIAEADVGNLAFRRIQPEEGISAEEMRAVDALPDTWGNPSEIVLPNGRKLDEFAKEQGITVDAPFSASLDGPAANRAASAADGGPQLRKNRIITRMVLQARDYACGRNSTPCNKWDYVADAADPNRKPAQRGLTYVYGGKNPAVRTRPVDGCPQLTHGVDCSGLIGKIAEHVGVVAPAGSANQSDPAQWKFPADWQLEYKVVSDGSIETGDLIAWRGHIGIADSDGPVATARFISATGAPGECLANIQAPRGPRSLAIRQWRGQPTRVLRLVTTLSGEFDLYLRCANQTRDAAVVRLSINNDNGGPFSATGAGTDYNGTPLRFTLSGSYDQVSNVIEGLLTTVGGNRADSFREKLLTDDTGYFTLAKVQDNGGCTAQARLVRVAKGSPLPTLNRSPLGTAGAQPRPAPLLFVPSEY